jgi:hypothetical protein
MFSFSIRPKLIFLKFCYKIKFNNHHLNIQFLHSQISLGLQFKYLRASHNINIKSTQTWNYYEVIGVTARLDIKLFKN